MSENRSFEDNAYRSPLADYSGSKAPAGSVVRFDYETCDYRSGDGKRYKKSALVYLPAGFDENDRTVRYNVLYLMHGGSDSPEWYLGGEGKGSDITRMLDTMLAEGRCEPFIICAVSYYNEYCSDAAVNCLDFHLELTNDIIPLFEKKYPTFAEDTTDEALRASRFHRAMGGFSMGGVTTWSVFMNRLDLFGYFLPMCGDCWAVEVKGGGSQSGGQQQPGPKQGARRREEERPQSGKGRRGDRRRERGGRGDRRRGPAPVNTAADEMRPGGVVSDEERAKRQA